MAKAATTAVVKAQEEQKNRGRKERSKRKKLKQAQADAAVTVEAASKIGKMWKAETKRENNYRKKEKEK